MGFKLFILVCFCLMVTIYVPYSSAGLGNKTLEEYYPWLANHVSTDRKIEVINAGDERNTGIYDVGDDQNRSELPIVPCNNPVFGIRGRCELLRECVLGPSKIQNLNDFQTHFCSFEGTYAGICC